MRYLTNTVTKHLFKSNGFLCGVRLCLFPAIPGKDTPKLR